MLTKAFIPYKGYYSTPFCRWQGSLANENAIVLGSDTARRWLASRELDPGMLDYLFLGITVGQYCVFYGSTWAAAMMGAEGIPGRTIMQACSTSTTSVFEASLGVENGYYENAYCMMVDRCSNGPHTIWPNPKGPGGEVVSENWMMENFNRDPWAGEPMIRTAENVAKLGDFTREDCDELALRRYEQYLMALADDRAFQKEYMFAPEIAVSRKKTILIEEDEGITPSTKEGLAKLRPVLKDGIHTFGAQTHPADGNSGLIVSTKEKAKEISADPNVEIQVLSYGYARAKKAHMAAAVVPAARMALEKAGLDISQIKVLKTHNPFASNDLYMAKEMGIDTHGFNNYGSSLVFGHPHAATGGRLMMEGIEEAVKLGGGYVMFAGCAAGDTGAAIVFKVN